MRPTDHPPVIWSIAGLDTAGGAGLSADQRAADALGVHLCPIAASLTAQHSRGVQAVEPVEAAWLDAQIRALVQDLPPRVIKTGLLGSVEAVKLVARWVDRLREAHPEHPPALVVDPVLGASAGGARFITDAVLEAYQRHLLPRATLVTPNRAEARRLLGHPSRHDGPSDELPDLAAQLKAMGAVSVAITGGDAAHELGHSVDWIDTPQAQGWLAGPRLPTPHLHGTGCTFASAAASALALGHTPADALVLARMATHHALVHGHAAGQGAGPVKARAGFAAGPAWGGAPLPWLGLGREWPWQLTCPSPSRSPGLLAPIFARFQSPADGLYGIVDTGDRVAAAFAAGLHCVQLRHKAKEGLAAQLVQGLEAAAQAGGTLFINDHWREALSAPWPQAAPSGFRVGLHLGQEDLQALTLADRDALLAARDRVALGVSSHSLWELAIAAGCGASVIACGPVQPTTTKDMPWLPQGADNLHWWVANSPVPVVAIGGLLSPDDLRQFASASPAALCVVRGLGATPDDMRRGVPALAAAIQEGRLASGPPRPAPLPHPVL